MTSLKTGSKIENVPFAKMRVREEIAQREFQPHWGRELLSKFDLEKLGRPVLNLVGGVYCGGVYWVVDGQHRVWALKEWLGDWESQSLECQVYRGLSLEQEADLFLDLNKTRSVAAYDKYRVSLTAKRHDETNIDAIVRKNGLNVVRKKRENCIQCVGALQYVYGKGEDCLDRDLRIVREAFGDFGLEADVIKGIGAMVARYNGELDDDKAIEALSRVRGGVNALRARAERLKMSLGTNKTDSIAGAAVEIINRGLRGKKKLTNYWTEERS